DRRPVRRLPGARAAPVPRGPARACADVAAGRAPDRPADRRPGGLLRFAPDPAAGPARRPLTPTPPATEQARHARAFSCPHAGRGARAGRLGNVVTRFPWAPGRRPRGTIPRPRPPHGRTPAIG